MEKKYKILIGKATGIVVLAGGLFGGGYYTGARANAPKTAYCQDLDGERRSDFVTESAIGKQEILLDQGDNIYRLLGDISDKRIKNLEKEIKNTKEWEKSIENKVRIKK